ncbi:MAG: hypothetical protein ACYS8Z_08985 [Planctomycetota bacterium]|jgi:peroxiredoxin
MTKVNVGDKAPGISLSSQDGKSYEGIIRSSFIIEGGVMIFRGFYKLKPLCTVENAKEVLV